MPQLEPETRGCAGTAPPHAAWCRQHADAEDRVGLRLRLRQAQARAGDIVLLHADESEALTQPYLAHAGAEHGAGLRVAAPGQSRKIAMIGHARREHPRTDPAHFAGQARRRRHRVAPTARPPLGAVAGTRRQARRVGAGQRPGAHQQGEHGGARCAHADRHRATATPRAGIERYRTGPAGSQVPPRGTPGLPQPRCLGRRAVQRAANNRGKERQAGPPCGTLRIAAQPIPGPASAAISRISLRFTALPKLTKSSATMTKAPGPPTTLSR